MPEVEMPKASEAAPTYRLDVQLHELLMNPPEQPRLLPPPPGGELQTLPEPVFPQYPELMTAPDEDYFPVNGKRKYKAKHVYRAAKGWAFPFFRSRIMPWSSTRSLRTCSTSGSATSTVTTVGRSITACGA